MKSKITIILIFFYNYIYCQIGNDPFLCANGQLVDQTSVLVGSIFRTKDGQNAFKPYEENTFYQFNTNLKDNPFIEIDLGTSRYIKELEVSPLLPQSLFFIFK